MLTLPRAGRFAGAGGGRAIDRALMMLAITGAGAWLLVGLSGTPKQKIENPGHCNGMAYVDPTRATAYLCVDDHGRHARILNGYNTERVIELLMDREKDAWDQLAATTDRAELLVYDRLKAASGKAEYGRSPRVHDIRIVTVSKTMDTGSFVVTLVTAGGVRTSLWVNGGAVEKEQEVRSITPY